MIDRHSHVDGELPEKLERHIDIKGIPQDLMERLAYELVVRAECPECGHEDLYVDLPRCFDEEECKNSNCDAELLFDS